MTELQKIEQKGNRAVQQLRKEKLSNGLIFMINTSDLPSNQCYLEYPDGSIKLVSVLTSSRDFAIIRKLSDTESRTLRLRYNLA
jgi:hypothetical protein